MGRPYRRLAVRHGNRVGALAQDLFVCDACQLWHMPGPKGNRKPTQCTSCGGLAFTYFPSKAEATRWAELCLLRLAGKINGLRRQVPFDLHVHTADGKVEKIGKYVCDFAYHDGPGATIAQTGLAGLIVEDVKGSADTFMSRWKRLHAEKQYGLRIQVVRR